MSQGLSKASAWRKMGGGLKSHMTGKQATTSDSEGTGDSETQKLYIDSFRPPSCRVPQMGVGHSPSLQLALWTTERLGTPGFPGHTASGGPPRCGG